METSLYPRTPMLPKAHWDCNDNGIPCCSCCQWEAEDFSIDFAKNYLGECPHCGAKMEDVKPRAKWKDGNWGFAYCSACGWWNSEVSTQFAKKYLPVCPKCKAVMEYEKEV